MKSLPTPVTKLFWGDNLQELNWNDHKQYITQTILDKGDEQAVAWLLGVCDQSYLKKHSKTLA